MQVPLSIFAPKTSIEFDLSSGGYLRTKFPLKRLSENMPLNFIKYLFCLLAFLLVQDVNSQNQQYYPSGYAWQRPSPALCDADSYCTPIRRCVTLRESSNWRSIGITCGFGGGSYRPVCCPTRVNWGGPVTRQTTTRRPWGTPTRQATPSRVTTINPNNAVCGESRATNIKKGLVMGGENATEGAWPWMVAIAIRSRSGDNYTPWCTGFLIDRSHVLSAAHCFHRKDVNLYQARIGRVDQTAADIFRITRIVVPQGYRQGMFYDDIAILTLSREVYNQNFNPICLPDEVIVGRNLEGQGTTVAGWGADGPNGNLSIILKELSLIKIVSNSECNNVFRAQLSSFRRQFPRGLDGGFLCAGYQPGLKDACGGDSGGPLMLQSNNRWFAVGIVSFGLSCGLPGVPGGYTRITQYLDWIRQNI